MPAARPLPSLLLVDAGNTRTKLGLFDDAPPPVGELPVCRHEWIVENDEAPPWDEVHATLAGDRNLRLYLTGSNPRRVDELRTALPASWPVPCALSPRTEFPLSIEVDSPERVGIDRLLNAIAANQVRHPRQAAVIVSSGTATTIDYVAPDGSFRGGAILPGFELSARALHQYTALLPLIPLRDVLEQPPDDLGRNTEQALQSGLYWGHVGAVREIVRRFLNRGTVEQQQSLGEPARHLGNATVNELPLILLTGGAAPVLRPHLPSGTRHEPQLPLQGLAILCTRG